MTDIVFLDTETLGLDPAAPIWEFAALRRFAGGGEDSTRFCIRHEPEPWARFLREEAPAFWDDYRTRYNRPDALDDHSAALMVHMLTRGAHVIGCNPGFDLERLTMLLQRHNITPGWHYHPDDIASMAKGFLAARGQLPPPPWKSDGLANALGVTTAEYERHTAMGDVLWTAAQYDKIMGGGHLAS